MKLTPGLGRIASYGVWACIAAIAVTAFAFSADSAAPFWIMAGFVVLLFVCIGVRVAVTVARQEAER
jgi:hypothetical protein